MNEGYLGSARVDSHRLIHIAELSRQSIIDSGATHLGFGGYFLFETADEIGRRGINVLAKVASLDAAFAMSDLWRVR